MPPHRTPEQKHAELQAGRYIEHLLLTDSTYFRQWMAESRSQWTKNQRTPPTKLDMEAVARVMARQLLNPGDASFDHRRLYKDAVRRAIRGEFLSSKTLRDVIQAFSLSSEHQAELHTLHEGGRLRDFVVGHLKVEHSSTFHDDCVTVQLHECHYIRRRQPFQHRSLQTIKSLVDDLCSYQFRYIKHDQIDLSVVRGGRPGSEYQLKDEVWAFDIELDAPLAAGDSASLEYFSVFKSPDNHPPYFNRAVRRAVESLEICVEFLDELPSTVLWAEWDDYRPGVDPIYEEAWRVKGRSVDRRLAYVEQAVFGFRWTW